MTNKPLPVTIRPRAESDSGYWNRPSYDTGQKIGNTFQDQCKGTCFRESNRIMGNLKGTFSGFAFGAISAIACRDLLRQPCMRNNWDAVIHKCADYTRINRCALNFHRIGTAFANDSACIFKRVVGRNVG